MAPRRMKSRRPRRKAPRRRSRVPRGLRAPKIQLKHYRYKFELTPQLIRNNLAAEGARIILPPVDQLNPQHPVTAVTTVSGSLGVADVSNFALACSFALNDTINWQAYTAMYDAYKINSVTITLEYLSNTAAVNGGGLLPTFYMYWDQDDQTVPTGVTQISGKQGVKKWQPTSNRTTKKFKFVPVTRNVVYGGTTEEPQGAVVPNKSQWLNCTNPEIPHFAFKLVGQDMLAPFAANTILNCVRLNYVYDVSFRSPLLTV